MEQLRLRLQYGVMKTEIQYLPEKGSGKNFTGENFWPRECFVTTRRRDDDQVRKYIRHQESDNQRLDQIKLFD